MADRIPWPQEKRPLEPDDIVRKIRSALKRIEDNKVFELLEVVRDHRSRFHMLDLSQIDLDLLRAIDRLTTWRDRLLENDIAAGAIIDVSRRTG